MLVNGIQVRVFEGKSAYEEAIDFLMKVNPLDPLKWNNCLAETALEHTKYLAENNLLVHDSSDGTSFKKRIEKKVGDWVEGHTSENCDQLGRHNHPHLARNSIIRQIIDDGVPSRGHRDNIFHKLAKFMGGAIVENPFSKGGVKGTIDFSEEDVQIYRKGMQTKA